MTATAPTVNLLDIWEPLPKQREFLKAAKTYRYPLYGGARGSGKSALLRWGALYRLLKWHQQGHRGVRVGLWSEDYPTLKDRQVSKIEREFPRWLGELKDTQTDGLGFHLADEYGGGAILLRNLDDPGKFVGAEFAGIAIEELTRVQKPVWDTLRGSLRWPGIEDTFCWAATNPLGIGLVWVRQLWIEREFPPELQALAPQFHFVRALPTDNPHLTQDYWADLRSQPAHVQRAWIEGDWYVPIGIMFESLRPEVHQVPAGPPRAEAQVEIAADWGYEHAAVALWIESYMEAGQPRHRVYREYVVHRQTPREWAQAVLTLNGAERPSRVLLDSAAWNRAQDGADSPAEQMAPVFDAARIALMPVAKRGTSERTSRVHGWMLLQQYFQVGATGPALRISDNCPTLWRQLTSLVRGEPPQDIEDTAPNQVDDAATALRYWGMMRPFAPTPIDRTQELERAKLDPLSRKASEEFDLILDRMMNGRSRSVIEPL